jgi:uncharacterized protein YnzC (UPF0291/DUF896 family)
MEGYLVFIIFAVIAVISWIKKANSQSDGGLQEKLNKGLIDLFRGNKNSEDLSEVKIYDENGNEITFNSNAGSSRKSAETVIYDEDGNVMSLNSSSPSPPPVRLQKKPKAKKAEAVVQAAEESTEPENNAEMYRDFIRGNGGSAIVIQEILSKPVALR